MRPSFSRRLLLLLLAVATQATTDLTQYVLPSTGENGGNTFPGVSLPFGMVKLGPDVYTGADSYSGFASSGVFTGFSMMHETGTGGAPKYGVVSQLPVTGNIINPLDGLNDSRAAPDVTTVGYYKSSLGSNITVELAATPRAGFYQYTFPAGGQPNVVIDVSHVLPSYRKMGLSQTYLGGSILTTEDHYEGFGDYNNGWNRAPDWRIYFCGYFNSTASVKTFSSQNGTTSTLAGYNATSSITSTARLGAVFTFNTTMVTSRVGISFISTAQACSNVNDQIPAGTSLSSVVADAKQVWNDQVLSIVTTTETNSENLQLLCSSMYHMHLLPSNRTGENPLWKSSEPYYDDTFTTWDLFRCTFSIFQIFQPGMHEEYIRSLIDIFRFDGYMPDARSSNFNGASQGGSNSDNVLGLYPMAGQTTFLIGSPWFSNTTISLDNGKSLVVTTTGGSDTSYYVQSLLVNGKQWTQSWLTWNDIFANGGTMDFTLGPEPKNWTTGKAPPSPASEFQQDVNPTTIVRPGGITMASTTADKDKERERRVKLRDIGLGIMALALFGISFASVLVWWSWFRMPRTPTAGFGEGGGDAGEAGDEATLSGNEKLDIAPDKQKELEPAVVEVLVDSSPGKEDDLPKG